MDNSEQLERLTSKLEELVKKYMELQQNNDTLNATIERLILEKESLINEKSALEVNLSQYNNISRQQGSSIDTMLGKIETLLHNNSENTYYNSSLEHNTIIDSSKNSFDNKNSHTQYNKNYDENFEEEGKDDNNSSDNKLDLARMSKLLNGF